MPAGKSTRGEGLNSSYPIETSPLILMQLQATDTVDSRYLELAYLE